MADEPMNVALKLNWVYGEDGPWTSPCTPEGRRTNVGSKVWCSQPENECQKLGGGGGVYHSGSRKGTGIQIHSTGEGKFAILTSRRHEWSEEERVIIAWFQIVRFHANEKTGESHIAAGDEPYAGLADGTQAAHAQTDHRQAQTGQGGDRQRCGGQWE